MPPEIIEYSAEYEQVEDVLMKAIGAVDEHPPETIAMAFALGIGRMMSGDYEIEPDAEANFVRHFLEFASAYFTGTEES